MCKNTYRKILIIITFIYKHLPIIAREEEHFCVKQDKVALNPYVKNKNCFLKMKFKLFSKSYPLSMKMRLDSGYNLFTLLCHKTVAKYISVNVINFLVCVI